MSIEVLELLNCVIGAAFGISITLWRHRFARLCKRWAKILTGQDFSERGYVLAAMVCGPGLVVFAVLDAVYVILNWGTK